MRLTCNFKPWVNQPRCFGTELSLTNRMWEVLLGIALHQHGISDEQLLDYLVRDGGGFDCRRCALM